ncbi:MAG TPA: hypothetical protein VIJ84_05630 [Gaiellaceae bacterium]
MSESIEFSPCVPLAAASVAGSFEFTASSLVAGTLSSDAAGTAASPAGSLTAG